MCLGAATYALVTSRMAQVVHSKFPRIYFTLLVRAHRSSILGSVGAEQALEKPRSHRPVY